VFNLYGNDRLVEWKRFRDSIETSDDPLKDVAALWGTAPFVNPYLNPNDPSKWPDPWHLVIDSRLDDLAIALGMLYTIKLTRRFMDTQCEIHTSMRPGDKEPKYILLVDNQFVLNLDWSSVVNYEKLDGYKTSLLYSK
jgi:hypothetical protein